MQGEEFQFGLEHQLTAGSMLGVRYVNKSLVDTIEDIGYLVEDEPGRGTSTTSPVTPARVWWRAILPGPTPAQPEAIRDYEALELSYIRQFVDNWSMRASYTYSELDW